MRLLDLADLGRSVSYILFPCSCLRNRRGEHIGRARKGQLYKAVFKGAGFRIMDRIKKQDIAVVLESLKPGRKLMC